MDLLLYFKWMIKKNILWYYNKFYSELYLLKPTFLFLLLVDSKEKNGVVAHMLLIFRFPSTEDPEAINNIVQYVLHKKLQDAVGPPELDAESVEIKSKFIFLV